MDRKEQAKLCMLLRLCGDTWKTCASAQQLANKATQAFASLIGRESCKEEKAVTRESCKEMIGLEELVGKAYSRKADLPKPGWLPTPKRATQSCNSFNAHGCHALQLLAADHP